MKAEFYSYINTLEKLNISTQELEYLVSKKLLQVHYRGDVLEFKKTDVEALQSVDHLFTTF